MHNNVHHHCGHDAEEHAGEDKTIETPNEKNAFGSPILSDKKFFFSALISVAFIAWLAGSGGFGLSTADSGAQEKSPTQAILGGAGQSVSALEAIVFPSGGIHTAATWGSIVPQLAERGVIDREKFVAMFERETPLSEEELAILDRSQDTLPITFTTENSRFTVDVLWAVGLAQQSDVLDKGPMRTAGPTEQFASTGGWTLGKSKNPMDYYSKWNLLNLSSQDQERVQKIAEGIYRPCCGNSTAFPDCNHGMAMLGLIELMVSQGVSEEDIFAAAKAANTYWFPDSMMEIATYVTELKEMSWDSVDAKLVVGKDYASGQGSSSIRKALQDANLVPKPAPGGGSCGA